MSRNSGNYFDPEQNGYVNPSTGRVQHKIGTTRRDDNRRKIPGEFDSRGLPLDGHPEKYNQPMSRDYQPTDFAAQFTPGQTGVDRLQRRARPVAPTSFTENFGPMPTGEPMRPTPSGAPQMTARPSTTQGGGIATAGVANPPAPNNLRPGQAATASLADRRTVQMKNFTPITSPTGNRITDAANLAKSMDIARNPTGGGSSWGDQWANGGKDSPEIQAMLDKNAESNAQVTTTSHDEMAAIGRKYGSDAQTIARHGGAPVKFETQASPQVATNPPTSGNTWFGPPSPAGFKAPTRMPDGKIIDASNPSAARSLPLADQVRTMGDRVPSPAPNLIAGTPNSPYSLFESPGAAYKRQQARVPQSSPGAPLRTSGFFDAMGKGNLSEATAHAGNQLGKIPTMPADAYTQESRDALREMPPIGAIGAAAAVKPALPGALAKKPEQFGPPAPWWDQKKKQTASAY